MSTENNVKKKKKKARRFTNRHGIMLVLLLAVAILAVNLVVYSYSWFTPGEVTGQGLQMEATETLRSELCEFSTYPGIKITTSNQSSHSDYFLDQIWYSSDPIGDNDYIDIPVGERVYFLTNIQNTDTKHPSVVSLYHHEMPADLGVAITFPSNTYHQTEDDYTDYFIVRNAYVKVKDEADVDGPGLLQVEWFVENKGTSTIRIRVSKQTVENNTGTYTADPDISWLHRHTASTGTALSTPIEWLYLMYN